MDVRAVHQRSFCVESWNDPKQSQLILVIFFFFEISNCLRFRANFDGMPSKWVAKLFHVAIKLVASNKSLMDVMPFQWNEWHVHLPFNAKFQWHDFHWSRQWTLFTIDTRWPFIWIWFELDFNLNYVSVAHDSRFDAGGFSSVKITS